MKLPFRIDGGVRTVLVFSGPDAVRYLNGQVTQDVRRVVEEGKCLPSCVTDAKGRIQFRVWLSPEASGAVRLDAHAECGDVLEARMTRYLIADDCACENRTGLEHLWHVVGVGVGQGIASGRWGESGHDLWTKAGCVPEGVSQLPFVEGADLEAWRIARGIPVEGRELVDGIFPAELGLEDSDVSFRKGCYIGQEVISRIRAAGKVNKSLARMWVEDGFPVGNWELLSDDGANAGVVTSVSPRGDSGRRMFLALVKRGRSAAWVSMGEARSAVRTLAP